MTKNNYAFWELQRKRDNLQVRFNELCQHLSTTTKVDKMIEYANDLRRIKKEIKELESAKVRTEYEI